MSKLKTDDTYQKAKSHRVHLRSHLIFNYNDMVRAKLIVKFLVKETKQESIKKSINKIQFAKYSVLIQVSYLFLEPDIHCDLKTSQFKL